MLKQVIDRFTSAPVIGVDLGSAVLKVVELERAEGRVVLRHAALVSVDPGPEAARALERLLHTAGITASQAAVALASPQVIVKPFQFPAMPKKELKNALRLEAEQSILNGHPFSDMAIDWHTLSSASDASIRGLLSVVPKTEVVGRLAALKAAGLRPCVVDVEGLALWNAYWVLAGSREASPKTALLINVGARTTNLVIAKGPDELMLVRDLPLGGQALELGQADEWVSEITDSLGYARSNGGLRTLDAVYVTGGGSGPKLIPLLKGAAPVALTFWNPLQSIARDAESPAVKDGDGPLLAIAIGLALRQPT